MKHKANRRVVFLAVNASYSHTSLAAMYLQAFTADMGFDWTTVESVASEDFHPVLHRIVQIRPDAIAATFYLFNRNTVLSILRRYKTMAPGCMIVAGGPEFLGDNRDFLFRERCIDLAVRGEGESAFRQLLTDIDQPRHWRDIPGFCGIAGGGYVDNGFAGEIANLDDIPSPYTMLVATESPDRSDSEGRALSPSCPAAASARRRMRAENQGHGEQPKERRRRDSPPCLGKEKPFIQLETSRGCRNTCAFCASGASSGVRHFSINRVRSDLRLIRSTGIRSVRIVDRTFNENRRRCVELLTMFREEFGDMAFHLEIDPALAGDEVLTEMAGEECGRWDVERGKRKNGSRAELAERTVDFRRAGLAVPLVPPQHPREGGCAPHVRALVCRCKSDNPRSTLHLDVGVQTFGAKVLKATGRRGEVKSAVRGLKALCGLENVAVHADLIAGLPGATLEQTFRDLRRLVAMRPAEIQLELLKLLPGTRLSNERDKFGTVASPEPPYEVLRTRDMSANDIHSARILCKLVDWFYEPESLRETICAANDALPGFWRDLVEFFGSGNGRWTTPSLENRFKLMDEFLVRAEGSVKRGKRRKRVEALCRNRLRWQPPSLAAAVAGGSKEASGRDAGRHHAKRAASRDRGDDRFASLQQALRYAWMKHGLSPTGGICEARPWKAPVPADAELVEGDAAAEICRMYAADIGRTYIFAYGRKDVDRRAVAVWGRECFEALRVVPTPC